MNIKLSTLLLVLFLSSSLFYLAMSQVPLDLDKVDIEDNLVFLYAEISGSDLILNMYSLWGSHFETVEVIQSGDVLVVNYILDTYSLKVDYENSGLSVISIKFSATLIMDWSIFNQLKREIEWSVSGHLLDYREEIEAFEKEEVHVCKSGYVDLDAKPSTIVVRFFVNLNTLKNAMNTENMSSTDILLSYTSFIKRKDYIRELVGQSILSLILSFFVIAIRAKGRDVSLTSKKILAITIFSFFTMTIFNAIHIYLWVKILNMPVGYSVSGDVSFKPFLPPYWAIPDKVGYFSYDLNAMPWPELGFTKEYITTIYFLTIVTGFILVSSFIVFIFSLLCIIMSKTKCIEISFPKEQRTK